MSSESRVVHVDRWTHRRRDGHTEGETDTQTERRTHRRRDGHTDGETDMKKLTVIFCNFTKVPKKHENVYNSYY